MLKLNPKQIAMLYLFLYYITQDMNGIRMALYKMGLIEGLLFSNGMPSYDQVNFDEDGAPQVKVNGVLEAWEQEFLPMLANWHDGEEPDPEHLKLGELIDPFMEASEATSALIGSHESTISQELFKTLDKYI